MDLLTNKQYCLITYGCGVSKCLAFPLVLAVLTGFLVIRINEEIDNIHVCFLFP